MDMDGYEPSNYCAVCFVLYCAAGLDSAMYLSCLDEAFTIGSGEGYSQIVSFTEMLSREEQTNSVKK